jgi:prepilin-type N-terminal cleavage/methylation domain-containing protein
MKPHRHNAFTLIELLVVVAIIGILISLLLPASQMLVESAKRKRTRVKTIKLAKAAKEYRQTYGRYPGQTQGENDYEIEYDAFLTALTNNPRDLAFIELNPQETDTNDEFPDSPVVMDSWGNPFEIIIDENNDGIVTGAVVYTDGTITETYDVEVRNEPVCVLSWGSAPQNARKRVYSWRD